MYQRAYLFLVFQSLPSTELYSTYLYIMILGLYYYLVITRAGILISKNALKNVVKITRKTPTMHYKK